jgi:hypothetical protein
MRDCFRIEIALALLLKIALLTGLWYVVFRPEGKRPVPQEPIAEHFQLPPIPNVQNPEEKLHDR